MENKIDIYKLHNKIKELGISLRELSKLTGISPSHLCSMFKGNRNMTIKKLNIILEATNIKINEILS